LPIPKCEAWKHRCVKELKRHYDQKIFELESAAKRFKSAANSFKRYHDEKISELESDVKSCRRQLKECQDRIKDRSPTYFNAFRQNQNNQLVHLHKGSRKILTYTGLETVRENCGMNIGTGIFTATKPGLYSFSIHGTSSVESEVLSEVVIRHNGNEVARGSGDSESTISASALIKLSKSDRVWVTFTGGLRAVPGRHIYFQGVQLSHE